MGKKKRGRKKSRAMNRTTAVLLGSGLFFAVCVIIFAIAIYSVHFFSIFALRIMFRAVLFLLGAVIYVMLISELIKIYKIRFSVLE